MIYTKDNEIHYNGFHITLCPVLYKEYPEYLSEIVDSIDPATAEEAFIDLHLANNDGSCVVSGLEAIAPIALAQKNLDVVWGGKGEFTLYAIGHNHGYDSIYGDNMTPTEIAAFITQNL